MTKKVKKISIFSFLILFLVNCVTVPMGEFDYIENAAKDAPPASETELSKYCGNYSDEMLSKAFEEGKLENVSKAKIVYKLEGMKACYTLYGEKGEVKKDASPGKKIKGATK